MSEKFKNYDPVPEEWYDDAYWETTIRYNALETDICERNNWVNIASYYILTEDFIREFQEQFDTNDCWMDLSTDQNLSEKFIEEFRDKVDWIAICAYQKLSVPFVEKYSGDVNWPNIFRYQDFSDEERKMLSKRYHHRILPREPKLKRWNDKDPDEV